jgi:hypothetical protein
VQEETKVFGDITIPAGSVVVEAQIYNSIPHNPGWFEPPEWTPGMAYDLVWIQHLVRAVVPSKKSKEEGEYPLYPEKPAYISEYNKEATAAFPLRKVAPSMVESIKEDIMLRDRLDFEVEDNLVDGVEAVPQLENQQQEQRDDEEETSFESDSDKDDEYKP